MPVQKVIVSFCKLKITLKFVTTSNDSLFQMNLRLKLLLPTA